MNWKKQILRFISLMVSNCIVLINSLGSKLVLKRDIVTGPAAANIYFHDWFLVWTKELPKGKEVNI